MKITVTIAVIHCKDSNNFASSYSELSYRECSLSGDFQI